MTFITLVRGTIKQIPLHSSGSTQGGVEWRVTEYQPERKEPLPDLNAVNATQPEEWEE